MRIVARLFLRFGHGLLSRLKTNLGMGAVAERFFSRCAAAAKRHSFFHRKFIAVRVDQFHFARHDVRTVPDCLDCYLSHGPNTKASFPKPPSITQTPISKPQKRQRRENCGKRCACGYMRSASCRTLQASGLRSPETELACTILRRESCAS